MMQNERKKNSFHLLLPTLQPKLFWAADLMATFHHFYSISARVVVYLHGQKTAKKEKTLMDALCDVITPSIHSVRT